MNLVQEKMLLPKKIDKVCIPPIKCQGIKTKLVSWILASVRWDGKGRWIEPFLGSGVIAFTLAPERALLADTNVHIIRLYQEIYEGKITPEMVKEFLEYEGALLLKKGEEHYYEIRKRFNEQHSSLDFLFLTRACFNGVMRFNKKGEFNVPFCKNPERFRQNHITKITKQVANISNVMRDKDWTFMVADWKETLSKAEENDFVYADPPYSGRNTDYYSQWNDEDTIELVGRLYALPCGFAMSTWIRDEYRDNPYFKHMPSDVFIKTFSHFYHVGSKRDYRHKIEEALIISKNHAIDAVLNQIEHTA